VPGVKIEDSGRSLNGAVSAVSTILGAMALTPNSEAADFGCKTLYQQADRADTMKLTRLTWVIRKCLRICLLDSAPETDAWIQASGRRS
jgi:hypothetical protein